MSIRSLLIWAILASQPAAAFGMCARSFGGDRSARADSDSARQSQQFQHADAVIYLLGRRNLVFEKVNDDTAVLIDAQGPSFGALRSWLAVLKQRWGLKIVIQIGQPTMQVRDAYLYLSHRIAEAAYEDKINDAQITSFLGLQFLQAIKLKLEAAVERSDSAVSAENETTMNALRLADNRLFGFPSIEGYIARPRHPSLTEETAQIIDATFNDIETELARPR